MLERILQRANPQELFLEVGTLAPVFPYQMVEYKKVYPSYMHFEQVGLTPFLLLCEFPCPPQHCEDNAYLILPVVKVSCKRNHGVAAVCSG